MSMWLYQMSAQRWEPEEYRQEVWEGEILRWPVGQLVRRGQEMPAPGDTVLLFFAKTGNLEPGIYGWGVVLSYDDARKSLSYRPTSPSDYLKMDPVWGNDIRSLIDQIRAGMTQGTMWHIPNKTAGAIRLKVRRRLR